MPSLLIASFKVVLMIRIAFIALILFSSSALAAEQNTVRTVIHDEAEAELLLGRHPITTPGFWPFGSSIVKGQSVIYEKDGVYFMYGGQVGFFEVKGAQPWGGDHLILKGTLTKIHEKGFIFDGIVTTEVLDNNEWTACIRQGQFEFSRDFTVDAISDKEYEDYSYGEDFWSSVKTPKAYDPQGRDCSSHHASDIYSIDVMVRSLGFSDDPGN